jgi:hypothetical protein
MAVSHSVFDDLCHSSTGDRVSQQKGEIQMRCSHIPRVLSLLSVLGWVGPAIALPLSFSFTDPVGDQTGTVDLVSMTVSFESTSGDYEIHLVADAANPFMGNFRINVNLFNPDTGTTACDPALFQDNMNDFVIETPTTEITLTGTDPRLTAWEAGDRVAANTAAGVGLPDCVGGFSCSVLDLPDMLTWDPIGNAEGTVAVVTAALASPSPTATNTASVVVATPTPTATTVAQPTATLTSPPTVPPTPLPPGPFPLAFSFTDPVGDQTGTVDLVGMRVSFDGSTGDYEILLVADPANPFTGDVRINVNLFNPDTGTTACIPSFLPDNMNDLNFDTPVTEVVLAGSSPRLLAWKAGDRVAVNTLAGLGVPDCTGGFWSGILDLPDHVAGDSIGDVEGAVAIITAVSPSPTPSPTSTASVVVATLTPTATSTAQPTVTLTSPPTVTHTPTPSHEPTTTIPPTPTPSLEPTTAVPHTLTPSPEPTTTVPHTLTPSPEPTTALCAGDCNHNRTVTVDELVKAVNIALGDAVVESCTPADVNGNGGVTIEELIQAVNKALGGCD